MEIVDAQIHPPDPATPWVYGEDSKIALSCELAREAMDSVGVDAALIHTGNAAYCEFAIETYPDRFAGCLTFDPNDTEVANFVSGYRNRPGMLALRTIARSWVDGKLTEDFIEGRFEPAYDVAEKHNVPMFIQAAGYLPSDLTPVVRNHPNLLFVLDHVGLDQQPGVVPDDPWERLPEVLEMARFANVALKLTGVPTLARSPFPFTDVWPYVHQVIDAFGANRVMWGSDFTRMRYAPRSVERGPRAGWFGLYSDAVNFIRDTEELTDDVKEQLLGGTIRRLLSWNT
ncbi:amidohydrolase family protein [Amycolatopsis pithecellobii]|uniref:amidohydrolase family protein n=1 Tax=Amycolatopsis pithecellobii TaxID=664692 RepID=UPI00140B2E21|nr:amidohydrolase family protein [Amycolatopsis pithecellobii]